ncbi:MAG: 30S ribosomal protein S17 [Candidatus Omnitrophica bacterium]|nr:30S ribosomal protein S17 [Candidatus Omnitrophota bacterium]
MNEAAKRINRRKFLQGTVLSDKMNKTRVVQVLWATKHPKYQKIMQRASKYKAHDEKNAAKTGDLVRIMETRPLSRDKRWVITEILQRAASVQQPAEIAQKAN